MEKQPKAQDQMTPSQIRQHDEVSKRESETNDITDRNQEARFGFTNIGSTGSVSIGVPVRLFLCVVQVSETYPSASVG
jgi:hypothetical protein